MREILIQSPAPSATLSEVLSGYINHIGTCIDGAGVVFAAATQDGPSTGDVSVVIMRRAWPSGEWEEIARFDEQTYGKPGYGSLEVLPDGSLCCCLSQRNAAGAVVFQEHIIPRTIARATFGGIDSLVRTCLRAVRQALVPLG